jgi:hypothetical protein
VLVEGSTMEAGDDGSTMDASSQDRALDSAMDGGLLPTCFVPYGCTTYVCVSSDGGADAGTSVSGAVESDGPRAVLVDAGGDGALGVNEAYAFASGDLIGSVSGIRVYDRALTAVEIGQAAKFTGAGANLETLRTATGSGLVFWLPLFGSPAVELNRCGP